jgi:poly-D-alanine transfer protein DltD
MKNITIAAFVILLLFFGMVSAQDNMEKKKIEFLISSVENLRGAKFIRNGSEYSGQEAAKHLRMKRQRAGDHVQTADDFIRLCASKSYNSGKPYLIRLSNGKTIKAEEYFREKLKEYKITERKEN